MRGLNKTNDEGEGHNVFFKQLCTHLLVQILFLIFLTAALYAADSQTSTLQLPKDEAVENTDTKLSLTLGTEYSSNLQKNSDPDRFDTLTLILNPTYVFSNGVALDVRTDVVKEFRDEERTHLTDTAVVLSLPSVNLIKDRLQFAQLFGATLPTDEKKYEDESYRGTVSLRPRLILNIPEFGSLKITNTLYLNKNIHEFSVKRTGEENVEYSLRNRIAIDYSITNKLSLSLINDYTRGWTYKSNSRETFLFAQELAFEILNLTSIYVGHQNQGAVRGPGNSGTNLSAFDDRSSEIYGGVSKTF